MIRVVLCGVVMGGIALGVAQMAAASPDSGQSTQSTSTSDAYYPNCSAARQAGVTPILRGQPGYRAGLDRDDDGVACE